MADSFPNDKPQVTFLAPFNSPPTTLKPPLSIPSSVEKRIQRQRNICNGIFYPSPHPCPPPQTKPPPRRPTPSPRPLAPSFPDESLTPRSALPPRRFSRATARVPATVQGSRPRIPPAAPTAPRPGPRGAVPPPLQVISARSSSRRATLRLLTSYSILGDRPRPSPRDRPTLARRQLLAVFTFQRVISELKRTLTRTEPKSHEQGSAQGIAALRNVTPPP